MDFSLFINFQPNNCYPYLSNDWEGEIDLEDIEEDELAPVYKEYKEFLSSNDLYDDMATLVEISRGYKIDDLGDFSTLGKMAARNNKYLFLLMEIRCLCLQIH